MTTTNNNQKGDKQMKQETLDQMNDGISRAVTEWVKANLPDGGTIELTTGHVIDRTEDGQLWASRGGVANIGTEVLFDLAQRADDYPTTEPPTDVDVAALAAQVATDRLDALLARTTEAK
jgi:hypothetical protein